MMKFVCVCPRGRGRAQARVFVCVEDSGRSLLQDSMLKSRGI